MGNEYFAAQLRCAIDGDNDALEQVLGEYAPLFRRLSVVNGAFDEDCYQYIQLRALEMTRCFKIAEKNIFPATEENAE
jgi:hypothetical protein